MPSYLSPGVYVEEVESGSRPIEGVGTSVAAFIGFAQKGPLNEPTLITNWTQFTTVFGDFVDGTYLATSVHGFFANGGGVCYIVRIGGGSGAGRREGARGRCRRRSWAPTSYGRCRASPGEITVEVTDPEGEDPPRDVFTSGRQARRPGRGDLSLRNRQAQQGERGDTGQVALRADRGGGARQGRRAGTPRGAVGDAFGPAGRGGRRSWLRRTNSSTDSYVGDPDQRTGLGGLEAVDEITMVAAPDLMSAYERGVLDLETVVAVQQGMITHCELMGDRIAILDTPPGLSAAAGAHLAQRTCRLRLQVRDAVLPVDQGVRRRSPDGTPSSRRAVTSPACGRATTRRAACTRPRRTR